MSREPTTEAGRALLDGTSGWDILSHRQLTEAILAIEAEAAAAAPLDVERLARAIRTAELRSQMDAERAGALAAESGPMPDWYRAYATDVIRALLAEPQS